jgi:hypothetical protein
MGILRMQCSDGDRHEFTSLKDLGWSCCPRFASAHLKGGADTLTGRVVESRPREGVRSRSGCRAPVYRGVPESQSPI